MCNTDTHGLAGANVTDMICHIDYRTCMHACRLAHDIASFFDHGGTSPKECLPCLMHKARVVTVLLFASQKMVEVAAALVGFCVGSVLVWAELLSP